MPNHDSNHDSEQQEHETPARSHEHCYPISLSHTEHRMVERPPKENCGNFVLTGVPERGGSDHLSTNYTARKNESFSGCIPDINHQLVVSDQIHDSCRFLSVSLTKRMRLVSNNPPPAHLLARSAIVVTRSLFSMVCCIESKHLVCCHDNGVSAASLLRLRPW